MATFKIGIQTMGNKRHQIDVKESDTVVDVKRKIADELQLGAADEQKLIHMGRILKDDQTLESVKIKANDVLVVMFSKKKATTPAAPAASSSSSSAPAPAPAPTPTTSSVTTPASTPATTSVTNSSSAPPAAPTTSAPTATATAPTSSTTPATAAPPGNYQQAASALLTGGAREDMIQNLMGLGFPRNEVELALRAAFNNPDRAADYLFNGIPDGALAAAGVNRSGAPTGAGTGAAGAAAGAGTGTGATGAAPTGGAAATGGATGASGAARGAGTAGAGAGGAGLGALLGALGGSGGAGAGAGAGGAGGADQVRQLLASNPQLIPMLLQQLSQTNPEVVQQIQENPAAFLQMLGGALGGAGGAGGGGGGAGGGGAGGPRSHVIQVTPEEKQAIDNLENLGFDRHRALEAFLLCDRNYELAANYLFENQAQFAAEDMEAQQNRGAGGGAGGGSGGGDDGEEGDGDDYGDMPE